MIESVPYPILDNNRITLKESSKDTSNPENPQYMTFCELEVVDFDQVKRLYANSFDLSEDVATSVDAVAPLKKDTVFIEFKNGKVNNREIKDKARDSLLIYLGIIDKSINYSRENIDFVVVYNFEKNPPPNQFKKGQLQETPSRVTIGNIVASKANEEMILFDLKRYESLYYRKIHTYSKEQFEAYLQSYGLKA